MKRIYSLSFQIKLAALAVLIASCSEILPDLPPPCEGEGYSMETHSCRREASPTCEGKDDCVNIGGANCAITSAVEDGHTYKVFCEDEFVGFLDNGKPGEKGESGLDGASGEDCSIAKTDAGVEITCGTLELPLSLSHGIIGEDGEDGEPGEDGKDGEDNTNNGTNGENCKIAQTDDGVVITCGAVELPLTLSHGTNNYTKGKDGTNGKDCTIVGMVITCGTVELSLNHVTDGAPGGKGETGATGNGCTIVQTDEGVDITCDNVIPIPLTHGTNGTNGSVITIDKDGYWCIDGDPTGIKAAGARGDDCKVEDKGAYLVMTCGIDKPVEWPKAMCMEEAYDPEKQFCDSDYRVKGY